MLDGPVAAHLAGAKAAAAFVGFLLELIQFERAFVMNEELGGESVHLLVAIPEDKRMFIRDLAVLINELFGQRLAFFAHHRAPRWPRWWNRMWVQRREQTVAAGLALAKKIKLPLQPVLGGMGER